MPSAEETESSFLAGSWFYQWAANQLTGSRPAAGIPLGQAGGVIYLDNPLTVPVIVALSVATCLGSWLLISGAAASIKLASSALSQSYDVAPAGLERLGKWLIVLTGAGAAAVAVYSAFAR